MLNRRLLGCCLLLAVLAGNTGLAAWGVGQLRAVEAQRDDSWQRSLDLAVGSRAPGVAGPDLERVQGEERSRRQALGHRLEQCRQLLMLNVMVAALLPLSLALSCWLVERREQARRRVADVLLRQQREWLEVALLGIADGVIASDARGRVVLINPAGEALTGWRAAEALGRPVREVFRLLHEPTRTPIGDPIRRALGEGTVAVDEQALLLARDGTERPIEDSGAPIRGPGGAVLGAILVFRDVTERRKVEEQLRQSNERLREADRQKDEFLAMLAHELRNPLAPVRNAAGVLRLRGDDPATVNWARELIERQTRHMTRMVDDLLDASRLARGQVKLQWQVIDLAALVRTTAEDYRPGLTSNRLALEVSVPDEQVPVEGDAIRLAQVLTNLLHNAAKFTEPGGTIAIRLERAGEQAVLQVSDTGAGIEPGLLGRVFAPFSQGDRSLERTKGGLGLGLAIVKGMVELHGGSVEASSAGPGKGTTFTVVLPVSATAAPEPTPRAVPEAPPRNLRVLVVEDNVDAAASLRIILELGGHEVMVRHNGRAGVQAAVEFQPDVVLCDLGLPEMSGFEVARALRGEPATRSARLIAVSGYGQEADQRRAFEAGFDRALVKPVDPDLLQELLQLG